MARRDGIKAGWRTKNFCPLWPPPSSGVTKGYRDAWKISLLILVGKKKRCEIIFFRLLWIFVFFFFLYVCLSVCLFVPKERFNRDRLALYLSVPDEYGRNSRTFLLFTRDNPDKSAIIATWSRVTVANDQINAAKTSRSSRNKSLTKKFVP